MTISQRNRYFKAGIALSSACLLGMIAQVSRLLPRYPELAAAAAKRAPDSAGVIAAFVRHFAGFPAVPEASFVSVAVSLVYALAASGLIYYFFEKTSSPEALFFGMFPVSFVFESMRLVLPMQALYGFPGFFLIVGSRILFFGRLAGLLSFFAASIFAAGFELQKQGNMVFAVSIAALIVSLGIPVDGLSWDTNLVMLSGYAAVFRLAEAGIIVISLLTFFIAAHTRGSKDYLVIAWGALLAVSGRDMLLNSDTWLIFPGFIMLCAGSWLAAERLHAVYLWL